jgi:hypothetical protein
MGWKPSYSAPKSPEAWAVDPRRPHALKRSAASTAFQPCPPGIRAVPLRRVFEPGISRPPRNLARVFRDVYPEAVRSSRRTVNPPARGRNLPAGLLSLGGQR